MSRGEVRSDAAEDAFDVYLDAALNGRAEPPDDYLARLPSADETLRARIRSIYAESASTPTDQPTPRADEPRADERRVGEFRLLRRLGEGGMGVVWEAEQESLGRRVALKLLRADLDASPEAVERFDREARTLAQLDHPGIVRVIAAGRDGDTRYLAMELVDGRGLDDVLRSATEPLETPRVLRWGAELARALAYAHELGVVHRDVKPSNVLVTGDDRALLVDFGIARDAAAALPTLTGPFVGSPAYAPPEQLTGARVDGRADLYALAATIYECLTGSPAFGGATVDQVIHSVLHQIPSPPSGRVAGLSRDVDVVLGTALAKRPERRYATAARFADDLDALLAFRPIAARPPNLIERARDQARAHPAAAAALATTVAALLVLGTVLFSQAAARDRRRQDDARAAVARAHDRFDAYRARHLGAEDLEQRIRWRGGQLESQFLSANDVAELDAWERTLTELQRDRDTVFHDVLNLLREAERLDPRVGGTARLRATVFAEKHREAVHAQDERSAGFYAELAASAEPGGPVADEVHGTATLTVVTEPPGAEVHVFRYVELADLREGGARRLVPVPLRGFPRGVTPGAIVESTNAGEERRVTAAPLHLGAESLVGRGPVDGIELGRGAYLAVAQVEGRATARRLFAVRDRRIDQVRLVLPAQHVPGCALVPAPVENEGDEPFWIMDREVTSAEYLAFLNAPETRAEIDAAPTLRHVPRAFESAASGGYWPRGDDGRFSLGADWHADWPVVGVSWEDAVAYARWRTERDTAFTYRLPTLGEALAAAGEPHRRFVFGMHFRPRFASGCFATATPAIEPVLSYPVDESPYGVFDLAGSASEWCDAWYDQGERLRRANFGNWADGKSERFEIWAASGWPPEQGSGVVGFRLVVEPR